MPHSLSCCHGYLGLLRHFESFKWHLYLTLYTNFALIRELGLGFQSMSVHTDRQEFIKLFSLNVKWVGFVPHFQSQQYHVGARSQTSVLSCRLDTLHGWHGCDWLGATHPHLKGVRPEMSTTQSNTKIQTKEEAPADTLPLGHKRWLGGIISESIPCFNETIPHSAFKDISKLWIFKDLDCWSRPDQEFPAETWV